MFKWPNNRYHKCVNVNVFPLWNFPTFHSFKPVILRKVIMPLQLGFFFYILFFCHSFTNQIGNLKSWWIFHIEQINSWKVVLELLCIRFKILLTFKLLAFYWKNSTAHTQILSIALCVSMEVWLRRTNNF